jgi:hypothetical protein
VLPLMPMVTMPTLMMPMMLTMMPAVRMLFVLGITRRMTGAVARLSHGTPRQLWASSASSLTSLAMRYVPQVQCRH